MTKRIFAVFLAAVILLAGLSCACFTIVASAEEAPVQAQETPAEPQEGAGEEVDEDNADETQSGAQALVDSFIAQLKERYGDQWQQYYDRIIADWGTVEEYLLSLVPEGSPDVVKSGWEKFVAWLGEYSPVWGSILAALFVLIVVLFGKKALDAVKAFFLSLFRSKNKEYQALVAQNEALLALLGENPKLEEKRAALKASSEEMMKNE